MKRTAIKRTAGLLALCLLLAALAGCARQGKYTESFFYMDTLIGITLYTEEVELAEEAFAVCRTLLAELDGLWARGRAESDVARWNASEDGAIPLDPRTQELLLTAIDVAQRTDGAFDPTVAPLIDLWQACGTRDSLPTDAELAEVRVRIGFEQISYEGAYLRKPAAAVSLDLGGIGKGAAVDALLAYLTSLRLSGGLVSFGSNVAVFGAKPDGSDFRVALRDPRDAEARLGVLRLRAGEVLSVSGDYERYVTVDGARYHHILDRTTGYPAASGLSSVAVVCSDGVLADALSTALLVMGREAALAFCASSSYAFEAILVSSDGSVTVTDGLAERFS